MIEEKILIYITNFVGSIIVFFLILVYLSNRKKFKTDTKKSLKKHFYSILVPCFNEEKNVRECVESLLNMTYPKNKIEIILINDASTDSTLEIMKSFKDSRIKIVNLKKNKGWKAKALMEGVKYVNSKTERLVVVDGDGVVTKNILQKTDDNFLKKRTGAVVFKCLPHKPKKFIEKLQYVEYLLSLVIFRLFYFINCLYVCTGILEAYDYKLFKKLGGFNINSIVEDLDIGLKITNAGYNIGYGYDSFGYTKVPITIRDLMRQRTRWYRGMVRTYKEFKHSFFNIKLGNLGMIILPLNLIGIFLISLIGMLFIKNFFNFIFNFFKELYKFYLTNFDIGYIFSKINFDFDFDFFSYENFLYIDPINYFFVLSSIFFCVVFFLGIKSKDSQKIRAYEYLSYFFIFFPLFTIFFLKDLIVELFFKERFPLEWKKEN